MPSRRAAAPTGRRPAARRRSAIYRRLRAPPLADAVPWADGPRLVGRRPVRAARSPALQRQGLRRRHARHRRRRGGHRRGRPAGCAAPGRPRPPLPDAARRSARRAVPRGARPSSPASCGRPASTSVDGWPVFDLVFLGIGPDGHLLSVFPGSPALDSPDLALAIPAPTHIEPQIERVTLNPAVVASPARSWSWPTARTRRPGSRRSSAASATRGAGPASSPGARGRPGSSTRRPLAGSRADGRRPDDRAGPRHRLARRDADRRVHVRATDRRSSSSTARPATTRRSVSSARCSAPSGTRPRDGSTRPGRLGRHAPVRHRARVRGRRGGRRRAGRATRARAVDVVGHSYGGRSRARGGAADRVDRAGRLLRGGADAARRELPPGGHRGAPARAARRRRSGRRARGVHDRGRRDVRRRTWPPIARTRSGRSGRPPPARSCASWRPRPTRPPRSTARGGPPAGPADPRRGEPAGLPRRDRGARRAARRRPHRRHRRRAPRRAPHPSGRLRRGGPGVPDPTVAR